MYTTGQQQVVAAFDFDGTLTTSDSLLAFIRFTHGLRRLLVGFVRHAPLLLAMKLGFCSNGKAKERVFAYFYKGTPYSQFVKWGEDFAGVAGTMLNKEMVKRLQQHLACGHTVCVVTASIDEWVRPICERLGAGTVLATRIEVSPDGTLTGRFITPDCYGPEKLSRLLQAFPERRCYRLYAYGDSRGDTELLAFADVAVSARRVSAARCNSVAAAC